jgi:hypothetical protein
MVDADREVNAARAVEGVVATSWLVVWARTVASSSAPT